MKLQTKSVLLEGLIEGFQGCTVELVPEKKIYKELMKTFHKASVLRSIKHKNTDSS